VAVPMVQVWQVGVHVYQLLVTMPMGVGKRTGRVLLQMVAMVPIVVLVAVLMFLESMFM
jgi:hypothetical protein